MVLHTTDIPNIQPRQHLNRDKTPEKCSRPQDSILLQMEPQPSTGIDFIEELKHRQNIYIRYHSSLDEIKLMEEIGRRKWQLFNIRRKQEEIPVWMKIDVKKRKRTDTKSKRYVKKKNK